MIALLNLFNNANLEQGSDLTNRIRNGKEKEYGLSIGY